MSEEALQTRGFEQQTDAITWTDDIGRVVIDYPGGGWALIVDGQEPSFTSELPELLEWLDQ